MAMEVLTMTDKAKRDQMFQDLRNSNEPNERQVVKFSGVEEIEPAKDGKCAVYQSTWSVAYPVAESY